MTGLSAQVTPFELALARPFKTARGEVTTRRGLLLGLSAGELVGYGAATPLPGFSQEDEARAHGDLLVLQVRLSQLQGVTLPQDAPALEALLSRLEANTMCAAARFALECALIDLSAKALGVSFARWLEPAASQRVLLNATLTAAAPAQCYMQALEALEAGFEVFKLKVGALTLAQDVERARAVRQAIGDHHRLRLDANGAWSLPEAAEAIEALKPLGLDFVEQPVAALEVLARLQALYPTLPLAADELVRSAQELEQVLAQGAAQVVVLKPALIGSALETLKLAQRARDAGVRVIVTTIIDDAVGRACAAHIAAAAGLGTLDDACGLATGAFLASDVADAPDPVAQGYWRLEGAVGHGCVPSRVVAPSPVEEREAVASLVVPNPLAHLARYSPDAAALLSEDGDALSWSQLYALAKRIAGELVARGVGPKDRVAVALPLSAQSVALIHAIYGLGAVLVAVNERLSVQDQRAQLERAKARLCIVEEVFAYDGLEHVSSLSALVCDDGAPPASLREQLDLERPAAILFTSGTTGQAKMPMLRWRNVVFSVMGSAVRLGHLASDVWLHAMPLGHVAGLSILWRSVLLGITVRLHHGADATRIAGAIVRGECTQLSLVARTLSLVVDFMEAQGRSAHPSFRFVLLGGGQIPEALLARCRALGLAVAPTFGMSEGCSQLLTQAPTLDAVGYGAGAPLGFTSAKLDDDGQLLVHGPTIFAGYMVERDGVLVLAPHQGWFETGDFAQPAALGRGFEIVARRQDRIVTGGENVAPAEVEAALLMFDGVAEACVVGLPDAQWGQRVVAVVVAAPGVDELDLEALDAHCRARLSAFKLPRQIWRWEALPKGALEKVSREAVRQRLSLALSEQN